MTVTMQPQDDGDSVEEKPKNQDEKTHLRGHRLSLTCLCVDSQDQHVFTGSKDGSIVKWKLDTGKPLNKINSITRKEAEDSKSKSKKYHTRHINSLAISSDNKFLASGGWDKQIRIWSPETLDWIHTFSGHRDEITALAFRIDHSVLYSGSADRSLALWTLEDDDNKAYIESLYGHESPITSLDTLRKERVLSAGGRDQSIRVWKIVEQAQTVFQSGHESADVVRYIDDKTFVSSGEDGSISIWSVMKRKPVFTMANVHKPSSNNRDSGLHYDEKISTCWITSLATFVFRDKKKSSKATKKRKLDSDKVATKFADEEDREADSNSDDNDDPDDQLSKSSTLIASGSCNSEIYIWSLTKNSGKYELVLHQTIPCLGFINDLRFCSDGTKLIAACGQEHKLGRWWKLKSARNCMRVFDVKEI